MKECRSILMKCVDNIASLFSSVLRWLESLDEDEKWWQLQTQVAQLCLLELELKLRANTRRQFGDPASREIPETQVIAQVRSTVVAMKNRNRSTALVHGRHALEQLSDLASS
jgi:hypothetical protein